MEVIAQGKFIRISAKKARPIANLVRGKNAKVSLEMLKLMPQRTAHEIGKVLLSAMSNAETNFNLEKDALTVTKITVDSGPSLKRWRPRAKGAASSIKKRTSHVTVVVSGDTKTKKTEKDEKITKIQTDPRKEDRAELDKNVSNESDLGRQDFVKKEQGSPKVDVKNKFFRRKTG